MNPVSMRAIIKNQIKIIKLENKIKICICIYRRLLEMVEPGMVVIARSGYVVGSSGVSMDDAANEYC